MSIMEIRNIRYSYDDKRNVLKNVNAELEAGKMYAILGSSGCGKTTLLSCLEVWTALRADRFYTTVRILKRLDLRHTARITLHLSSRATI